MHIHVPRDKRRKLDPKAKKCIFVGYGKETKGYRLFDLVRGKITFSWDVVLNEEAYGGVGGRSCESVGKPGITTSRASQPW